MSPIKIDPNMLERFLIAKFPKMTDTGRRLIVINMTVKGTNSFQNEYFADLFEDYVQFISN